MFSTRNRAGFVLAALLALPDLQGIAQPTPEGEVGEVGPPFYILVVGFGCGVLTLVGVGYGWMRGNRTAIRVAAGARIISMIGALPALFIEDLPTALRVAVSVFVLLTLAAVVLMLTPPVEPTASDDVAKAAE
jgi:hypothetical protein